MQQERVASGSERSASCLFQSVERLIVADHVGTSAGEKFDHISFAAPNVQGSLSRIDIPQVTVKVNFDRHNRAHIAEVFDELVAEGIADRVDVKPEAEHGVLIGPDGSIYKCISFVGRPEFSVGSVLEDDDDRPAYDAQMNVYKRTEDCFRERCPYLPVCGGGSAYESAVRTGDYDRRFCTKSYLAEFHFKRHFTIPEILGKTRHATAVRR